MLQVRVRSYLTSALRYKSLISNTYHPDILYLREQGCEDPWLFFEAKKGSQTKEFGNPVLELTGNSSANIVNTY